MTAKNYMHEQADIDAYNEFKETAAEGLRKVIDLAAEVRTAAKLSDMTDDIHVWVAGLRAAMLAAQRIVEDCKALADRGEVFRTHRGGSDE